MSPISEGNLTFTFRDSWNVSKLDDWAFYRKQFQKHFEAITVPCKKCKKKLVCKECETRKSLGAKSCDFLAIDGAIVWLIEVKDYRMHQRTKVIDLADEIALKVRDSLAMILAASKNASLDRELKAAKLVAASTKVHVVLHLEQPNVPSRLRPKAINPASVLQRLKQLLKYIDPHPQIAEVANLGNLQWQVA